MRKLFIAGGAGFIGSNFVHYVLGKYPDAEVVVYDKLTYAGNLENLEDLAGDPRYRFIRGDIGDPIAVANAIEGCDAVVNLAAETHVDRSLLEPDSFIQTNVHGTWVLLEAALRAGVERYLQVSCYDESTRALTKDGLKHFSELREGELVLSINPNTGVLEEKPIEAVIVQDYSGPMVWFRSSKIDLMVTPNHRMFFQAPWIGETQVRIEPAEKLTALSCAYLPRGRWQGNGLSTVDVPGVGQKSARDVFYLVGQFLGDGFVSFCSGLRENKTGLSRDDFLRLCRDKGGRFTKTGKLGDASHCVSRSHRVFFDVPIVDKARKPLEECLDRLGIQWSAQQNKSGEHVYFCSKRWFEFFEQFGRYAWSKSIPDWMLEYDSEYLECLLRGLIDTDGSYLPSGLPKSLTTTSERLMHGVCEICIKLGMHPRFVKRPLSMAQMREGRIVVAKHHAYNIYLRRTNIGIDKYAARTIPYSGKIWCVKVADNANLVVERNGYLSICGNTDEVYGSLPQGSAKETDSLNPSSPYSASKAGGDMMVNAYFLTHGLPTIITRGSNNFGPYQYPEKALPVFILHALDDKPLPVYGDGQYVRDWMYVLDHCSGIDTALRHGTPGEVYNVGGGNEMTNLELIRRVLRLLGKPESLIHYVKDRPGHDRRYSVDCSKLKALGWQPAHPFDAALAETVTWYRDNEAWWRKIQSGEYRDYYRKMYEERGAAART